MLFIYKNWDCTIKIFQTHEITAVTVPYVTYIPSTLSYSLFGQCLLVYIYSNYISLILTPCITNQQTLTRSLHVSLLSAPLCLLPFPTLSTI